MDQLTHHHARAETQGDPPSNSEARRLRRGHPDPAGEHRLDGEAENEVQSEKRPRLPLQHGEGERVEMVSILGEDQRVEQEKADLDAGQQDAEGQHESGLGKDENYGDEKQERDVGEHAQVAHIGEDGVDPTRSGSNPGVVPQVTKANDTEERRVDDGEPAPPPQQPSPWGYGVVYAT